MCKINNVLSLSQQLWVINNLIFQTLFYIIPKFTSRVRVKVMVFNATFKNISVIWWQPVLLVEETGLPEKATDLLQVTDNFIT